MPNPFSTVKSNDASDMEPEEERRTSAPEISIEKVQGFLYLNKLRVNARPSEFEALKEFYDLRANIHPNSPEHPQTNALDASNEFCEVDHGFEVQPRSPARDHGLSNKVADPGDNDAVDETEELRNTESGNAIQSEATQKQVQELRRLQQTTNQREQYNRMYAKSNFVHKDGEGNAVSPIKAVRQNLVECLDRTPDMWATRFGKPQKSKACEDHVTNKALENKTQSKWKQLTHSFRKL
jgi:hypothetical protein